MRNPFRHFFHPRTIGLPLGQHVPADPADHAEDFAHRYAEPLDWQAGIRMEELDIPKDRIGSNDHLHGIVGRAFNPYEREGGGITHAGQVNLDSGDSIRSGSPGDTAVGMAVSGRSRACATGRTL